MAYRPEYMLINWDKDEVVGSGNMEEVRSQLKLITDDGRTDSYAIAKVEVLSEMLRVES